MYTVIRRDTIIQFDVMQSSALIFLSSGHIVMKLLIFRILPTLLHFAGLYFDKNLEEKVFKIQ